MLTHGVVLIPDKDGPRGALDEWLLTSKASHAGEVINASQMGTEGRFVVKLLQDEDHDGATIGEQSFESENAVKEEAIENNIAVETQDTAPTNATSTIENVPLSATAALPSANSASNSI